MAARTYLIGLYLAANALYQYISRWQPKILEQSLTTEQITCLNSTLTAVKDCVKLFKPAPPNP